MKPHRILLTVSLIAFAIDLLDIGTAPQWFFARPIGAVAFCLFMIFKMLDKEMELFDQQEKIKHETIAQFTPRKNSSSISTPQKPRRPYQMRELSHP